MCTPVAAGVVLGITSMASQSMQIKAQQKQIANEASVAAANAVERTRAEVAALNTRRHQEATKVTVAQIRRVAQGRRERSTIAARTADSIGGGASQIRDVVSSVIQEKLDMGTMETSKDWTDNQLIQEQLGSINKGQSSINAAQAHLKSGPGGWSSVLQVIGAGVSGYSQGTMLGQGMSSGKRYNEVLTKDTVAILEGN